MRKLVLLFALMGPIALPALLRIKYPRMRAFAVWCITNLATFLPMVAMTLWMRAFPGPSCRVVNPGAICDGIPADAAWQFYAMFCALLAVWGVFASAAATAFVFRKK